jgi:DNA-binding NarL/FixJ family response regulator
VLTASAGGRAVKILLVDDHALFRAGLRLLLRAIRADAQILEASASDEAVALAAREQPQLCLLDLKLRQEEGLDALARLREAAPALVIVVVSANEEPGAIRRSLDAGAMGYIPKSAPPEVLGEALRQVLAGRAYLPAAMHAQLAPDAGPRVSLTPRQSQVLGALGRGLPTKLIARELALSEYTVKEYIAGVFQALGVHNRTEAVIAASRLGIDLSAAPAAGEP